MRPVPCRRSASGRAAAAQAPLATPSDTAAVERSALVSHAHERHQERQDFASRLSRADRVRLLERLDELADLDREMRRPGTLARPHSSPATAAEPESRRSQW